jgi:hypothetical protein
MAITEAQVEAIFGSLSDRQFVRIKAMLAVEDQYGLDANGDARTPTLDDLGDWLKRRLVSASNKVTVATAKAAANANEADLLV